jgi:hypothetical protein
MRRDEAGHEVPATLGEYRALVAGIWGDRSEAAKFMDEQIRAFAFKSGKSLEWAAAGLVPNTDREMRAIMLKLMKGRGGKKP